MTDVKVVVLHQHRCNRLGRQVFPDEVIEISIGELQKRSRHPRQPLVRLYEYTDVGPAENQSIGPTETKRATVEVVEVEEEEDYDLEEEIDGDEDEESGSGTD